MAKKRMKADHFEGGKNLTKGGSKEKDQDLAAKMQELQDVSLEVEAYASDAGAGGNATETMTVTGLLATDTILSVTQKTAGAGAGKSVIAWANQAADALDVTWDADPGAGAVVVVAIKRKAFAAS